MVRRLIDELIAFQGRIGSSGNGHEQNCTYPPTGPEITENNGWINIKPKKPLYDNHPAINGPAFLDYSIEKQDHSELSLEDRSRNVWLRDENGRGIQSVSYCGGMGIWQVSQGGQPMAASDLPARSKQMTEEWLAYMDKYILENFPEVEDLLKS